MTALTPELTKELEKLKKALQKNDVVSVIGPALASPPLPDGRALLEEIAQGAAEPGRAYVLESLEKGDLAAAIAALEGLNAARSPFSRDSRT